MYSHAYQQQARWDGGPGQLILMLYNGGIRFCDEAVEAIEDNGEGPPVPHRAQEIVAELIASLNMEAGSWPEFPAPLRLHAPPAPEANLKDQEAIRRLGASPTPGHLAGHAEDGDQGREEGLWRLKAGKGRGQVVGVPETLDLTKSRERPSRRGHNLVPF